MWDGVLFVTAILLVTRRVGRAFACQLCGDYLGDDEGHAVEWRAASGSVRCQPFCLLCVRSARSLLRLVRAREPGSPVVVQAAVGVHDFNRHDERCSVCGVFCSWCWVKHRRDRCSGVVRPFCPDCVPDTPPARLVRGRRPGVRTNKGRVRNG